ncbi:MAG: ATP-binding protein, partial [Chloroflexota bacterium]
FQHGRTTKRGRALCAGSLVSLEFATRACPDRPKGHFLLLLDGFNALSTADINHLLSWTASQAEQYPNNKVIMALRPYFNKYLDSHYNFTVVYLETFGNKSLEELAGRWSQFIATPSDLPTVLNSDEVYTLAKIPYQFLMLLSIIPHVDMVPIKQSQLYALYISLQLSLANQLDPANQIALETVSNPVLQRIAFAFHEGRQIVMDEQAFEQAIQTAITAVDASAEELSQPLKSLYLQSGVIIEPTENYYRFAHLTLQEFLIAQAQDLVDIGLNQLLMDRQDDPWWYQVQLFYQELTDATNVIDKTFTQATAHLSIDNNQVYTLSLLDRNLSEVEANGNQPLSSEGLPEAVDFETVDEEETDTSPQQETQFKVLVVDDTPQNIQLARFILQREKYVVVEASNGKDALELIKTERPSLILSDIQMPGMNGYEFCQHLKADKATKNIPFIFITAFSRSTKEAAKGLQIGADDYITRPFAPEELLARIGANVRIHQAEEAARRRAVALARRNRELALLNHIQRSVTSSLNLDDVLDATMKEVHQVLKAQITSLWFVDKENKALLLAAAYNESAHPVQGMRLPLNIGIPGQVARTGKAFFSRGISTGLSGEQPAFSADDSGMQSILCVPLRVRQRVIGILQALHEEADRFNHDDVHLLTAVADAVTVAIENAWLFGQIQLFNQQLEQKVEARTHELAREKDKTETILINIADGLLVIDPEYKIVMANRAAEEILTFKVSEEMDRSIAEDRFNTPLWQFVRDINDQPDPTYSATTEIASLESKDQVSIQAHAAKMWDGPNQNYTGTVIVLRDITALQEVDRMKARFMAGITHELKTPLAIITLHVGSLLKYKSLDEAKKQDMIGTIQRQTFLLERLVENILQLSRLDSGMLQLEQEPINLTNLSHQISTELEPLAREKGLRLNFNYSEQGVTILGDNDQIERVVRNLVDNAIKYTPSGEITVAVSLSDDEMPQAVFSVTDTGLGLSPEQIARLFERFYRADPSHNIPGTGLGLSISQEIINLHKGEIQVESTLGEGSTFTVYLPVANNIV